MNDINQDRWTTVSDFFESFKRGEKVVGWRGPYQKWEFETNDDISSERMALVESRWPDAKAALTDLFDEVPDHWGIRVRYSPPDEQEGGMWTTDIWFDADPKTYFGNGETLAEAMDDVLSVWRKYSVFSEAEDSLSIIASQRSLDVGNPSVVAKAAFRLLRARGLDPAVEITLGHLETMLGLAKNSA